MTDNYKTVTIPGENGLHKVVANISFLVEQHREIHAIVHKYK